MAMANYPRSTQHRHSFNAQDHVALASNLAKPGHKALGGLEKEDIFILVLSAILVVATIWLATRVL